jgi:hypothetical protein
MLVYMSAHMYMSAHIQELLANLFISYRNLHVCVHVCTHSGKSRRQFFFKRESISVINK